MIDEVRVLYNNDGCSYNTRLQSMHWRWSVSGSKQLRCCVLLYKYNSLLLSFVGFMGFLFTLFSLFSYFFFFFEIVLLWIWISSISLIFTSYSLVGLVNEHSTPFPILIYISYRSLMLYSSHCHQQHTML